MRDNEKQTDISKKVFAYLCEHFEDYPCAKCTMGSSTMECTRTRECAEWSNWAKKTWKSLRKEYGK